MLQIHLFGHCRMFVDQQPHRLAGLPKTTPLLAYLLLHRHTAVPRDHLAFLLWDDVPESEARANLRRHLHDLRRSLPQNADWVVSDTKTVQWNPAAPFWLDVAEFERLCQDEQRLAEAVTLYTGDLLPDLYDDWLTAERERYQTLYAATMIRLMERERRRGDLPQAMMVARQLLRHDSLREDVVRSLMQMRHESGDRAGAMQLYQQFKERLAEELGVPPMPETTAVYNAITANTPSPRDAPIAHPTPASSSPPHNLPARLTRFIGREEELSQICHLIGTTTAVTRLLTITGPGGTGKTRLALESAAWLCQNQPEQFPDGLFFVGLAALTNVDHVVTAVAETVGVQETSGQTAGHTVSRSLLQNLSEQLRAKRLLLVLDNFEHLLEAAAQVSELLTVVPGLHILVTSQAVLHLYGEYEFPLAPLPLADLDHLPPAAELLKVPAIALFVERLQAARHDFKLTDSNARPVAEICTCLDGMPLALELAAARGKLFTPEAMLAQLHSRLHFLSGQARNLPARHQTLRATLDWSYHLLTETEQLFFAALSLFAGSFGYTAVNSLFNPDLLEESLTQRRGGAESKNVVASFVGLHNQDAADLLASLVDKNMLRQLPDEGDEPRFRMLQTLREYGLEKVAQMETAVQLRLHQQFAAVYVVWAEQAEQGLRSGDQNSWLKRLRLEDANIMAAQEWLFAHADEPHSGAQSGAQSGTNGLLAARLVATQDRYWSLQGRFSEARSWFTQALNYRHLLSADEQVKLINKAGVVAQHQGDYAAAAILHESALNQARQEENPELIASTLHYLGFAAGRQGRYEEARGLLEESLALNQELPDTLPQITTTLNNLAIVLRRLEAYDEAIVILEKALALKRQLNDQLGIPAVLGNLSQLLAFKGHFAQALAYAKEGLTLRQHLQDKPGMLVSLSQMADMAIETGQDGRGIRLLSASLTHRQRMNLPLTAHVQAETEAEIANLRARLGDDAFAAEWAVGAAMSVEEAVAYALAGEV